MKETEDFIVNSIGVSGFLPRKKGGIGVVVAYSAAERDNKVSFVFLEYPVKRLYSAEDFFMAIAHAEKVGKVIYQDREDRVKDIFICRAPTGKVLSFVPRDDVGNRSLAGFAEIASGDFRFCIRNEQEIRVKPNVKNEIELDYVHTLPLDFRKYEKGSLAYAVVNAYNACLLGQVFYREELALETQGRERVKIEVRTESSSIVENSVLYVVPVVDSESNFVSHYLTEEFEFVDGEKILRRRYKITYTTTWHNGYSLREI